MEGRFRILLLTAALAGIAAPPAQAADNGGDNDQVVQPQVQRRTIKAPDIDTENFEVGVFVGALSIEDFGVHPVYGLRAAYHVTEDFFLEGTYGRSKAGETSYETLSGSAKLLTDQERQLSYYDISVGYNVLPGEAFIGDDWAFNTALYVVAGIGNTSFAGDDHFTTQFGAGYRLLANDWLAVHADVRDHIFDTDLLGEKKTTHNLEFHAGLTVFF